MIITKIHSDFIFIIYSDFRLSGCIGERIEEERTRGEREGGDGMADT